MSPGDGGQILELELDSIPPGWLKDNKIQSGEMEMIAPPGTKIEGNKLRVPYGLSPEIRQKQNQNQGNNGNKFKNSRHFKRNNDEGSNRNLATTIDNDKRILVVRVNGNDQTPSAAELSDSIFGTSSDPVNLKSQMAACSKGQLTINPAANNGYGVSNGVLQVTISSAANKDKSAVETEAINAMRAQLGGCTGSCGYDHVMLCLPPETNQGWIGKYISCKSNKCTSRHLRTQQQS